MWAQIETQEIPSEHIKTPFFFSFAGGLTLERANLEML